MVYSQMLNPRGGIEADVTVTRLAEDRFWVVSGAATRTRDLQRLQRLAGEQADGAANVVLTDVTSAYAVLAVMGPRSRDLLARASGSDLSATAFPFGACREIDLAAVRVRASRVSYVGELGWELYIPAEFADFQVERSWSMGAYKPSSLIDWELGRAVEVEPIWGEPWRQGRAAGVDMPRLELLYRLLQRLTR